MNNGENWRIWLEKHQPDFSFLQSYEWGEILLADNQDVARLAVMEGEKMLAVSQVVYKKVFKHGKFALSHKGPVLNPGLTKQEMSQVYETFARYFKKQNCLFWRFEPSVLSQTKSLKFIKTLDTNPRATLIKDVQLTEEQLLASFHPKVRYNIRLSQRKGLIISETKDFAAFWRLMQETGERDEFSLHPEHTYRHVVESGFAHQITAYYNNIAIASGVFVGAGQRLFYVYGASDHAHRELMAPHLIQWEAIKLAKKLGLRYYDFFGIAPGTIDENSKEYVYDKNHPYARVTEFKLRFNGLPIVEPGTYDMVLSPLYYVYVGLRKLRRLF